MCWPLLQNSSSYLSWSRYLVSLSPAPRRCPLNTSSFPHQVSFVTTTQVYTHKQKTNMHTNTHTHTHALIQMQPPPTLLKSFHVNDNDLLLYVITLQMEMEPNSFHTYCTVHRLKANFYPLTLDYIVFVSL